MAEVWPPLPAPPQAEKVLPRDIYPECNQLTSPAPRHPTQRGHRLCSLSLQWGVHVSVHSLRCWKRLSGPAPGWGL